MKTSKQMSEDYSKALDEAKGEGEAKELAKMLLDSLVAVKAILESMEVNTPEAEPSNREKLLGESLHLALIACGVLGEDSEPSGPELICAAETFAEGKGIIDLEKYTR